MARDGARGRKSRAGLRVLRSGQMLAKSVNICRVTPWGLRGRLRGPAGLGDLGSSGWGSVDGTGLLL